MCRSGEYSYTNNSSHLDRCKRQLEERLSKQDKTITNLEKTIERLETTDRSNTGIISKLESQLHDKHREIESLSQKCEEHATRLHEQESLVQSLLSEVRNVGTKIH